MQETNQPPEKSPGPSRAFWLRATDLLAEGSSVLGDLPRLEPFRKIQAAQRHEFLEECRVDLYAISSIIAGSTIQRALDARESYPPYGLARSMFSEFRIIADRPEPVKPEYIDGFFRLGRACIDTVVFHLDAEIQQMRHSEKSGMHERLAALLALFADGASAEVRARMRDPFSFMYGGLQFGTSTIVQLLEVMSRILGDFPELSGGDRAEIMRRSVRPAHQLSAVNVERIVSAYTRLQPPAGAGQKGAPAGWMDRENFVVERSGDQPRRVSLRDDGAVLGDDVTRGSFKTQGCPARVSPTGGPSPISALWSWFVDLSEQTGLLAGSPS